VAFFTKKNTGSEASLYGFIDKLVSDILQILSDYGPAPLKFNRNVTESSASTKASRPDWLVHLFGALVAKGEEKDKGLALAINDLESKMIPFDPLRLGNLPYILLCC
jgi:hypothetical protein